MKISSLAILALLAGSTAALAGAPAGTAVAKSTETPAFAAVVPDGWSPSRDDAALRLSGPADENGLASLIAIRYYAPGDKSFPNAASYVKRQSTPSRFDPDNAKPAVVSPSRAGGRKATRIVKDRPRAAHPGSMNAKDVECREEIVVVPGGKGFYVLTYAAPLTVFDRNRPAFLAALAGFKPKL